MPLTRVRLRRYMGECVRITDRCKWRLTSLETGGRGWIKPWSRGPFLQGRWCHWERPCRLKPLRPEGLFGDLFIRRWLWPLLEGLNPSLGCC